MKGILIILLALFGTSILAQNSNYHWYQVGDTNDIDGTVRVLFNDGEGHLYAGGDFTKINGQQIYRLAMWDGEIWHDLEFPNEANVKDIWAIEKIGDTLYVGGRFNHNDLNVVAKYYNGNWYPLGKGLNDAGFKGFVSSLEVVNGSLYVGGDFENAIQSDGSVVESANIVRWSGDSWHEMPGSGLYGSVNCMASHNGKLYVGGEFYEDEDGITSFEYVVEYNPTSEKWMPMVDKGTGIDGVDSYVWSIMVNDTAIFVGGSFDEAGGKTIYQVAYYSNNEWHGISKDDVDDEVNDILIYKDELYIGGDFTFYNTKGDYVSNFAVLSDSIWEEPGEGLLYPFLVNDMALLDTSIYVAGSFDGGGSLESENLVKLVKRDSSASTTGVASNLEIFEFSIRPNPASTYLDLHFYSSSASTIKISLYDVMGRLIHAFPLRHSVVGQNEVRLALPKLSTGTYFLKVNQDDFHNVKPFVISD